MTRRSSLSFYASALILLLAVGVLFIPDMTHPLLGAGDVGIWEFFAWHLSKHITFFPWVKINFFTTDLFYPAGVDAVFQASGLEADYFFMIFNRLFGKGPWLQFYFLASLAVTAYGARRLFKIVWNETVSSLSALVLAFGNLYILQKFPDHLNIAVCHWAVLGVVCDSVLLKKFFEQGVLSTRLILLRMMLATLCLGLDLGYVAGFSLTSFVLTFFWLIAKGARRNSVQASPLRAVTLPACTTALATWFYFIPVCQIFIAAKMHFEPGTGGSAYWANPLRLILPWFSLLGGGNSLWQKILHDSPEEIGAMSPGWFLLIPAVVGLAHAFRNARTRNVMPFMVLCALCLVFHPSNFGVLKIFPWFSFNRVSGRSTLILPALFVIFAQQINFSMFRKVHPRRFMTALLILFVLEFAAAADLHLTLKSYLPLTSDFETYLEKIGNLPGEAILDWPFCAIGGNGVGKELCPYFEKTSHLFTLERLHGKKIVGGYFGRLYPHQTMAMRAQGWQFLFQPDRENQHQTRCFNLREWQFVANTLACRPYAGMQISEQLVTPACVSDFESHLGKFSYSATDMSGLRLLFFKNPFSSKDCRSLNAEYFPLTSFVDMDLLTLNSSEIETGGLSQLYQVNGNTLRMADKDGVAVRFFPVSAGHWRIDAEMKTLAGSQQIRFDDEKFELPENGLFKKTFYVFADTKQPARLRFQAINPPSKNSVRMRAVKDFLFNPDYKFSEAAFAFRHAGEGGFYFTQLRLYKDSP